MIVDAHLLSEEIITGISKTLIACADKHGDENRLAEKVGYVRQQLLSGDGVITYDPDAETVNVHYPDAANAFSEA